MNQVVRLSESRQPSVTEAVKTFLAACKARNLSDNTTDYYRYRLTAFVRFLESQDNAGEVSVVTPADVRAFLTDELDRNSPTTAAHSYVTLSAFFSHLEREGYLVTNPMRKVQKPKRRNPVIDTFSASQVEKLLSTCKGRDFYAVRDRVIILTLLDCGLRASELCGLTLEDVSLEEQSMCVLGKGDKERLMPFGATVKSAFISYLTRRGGDDGAVFVNHYGERLTRYGLRHMIERRGKAAGITGIRLSPHTLRHTFAVSYLRNGGDVFTLQKLLGHTDLKMTRHYAELADSDVMAKHRQCSPMDALKPKTKTGRRRLR